MFSWIQWDPDRFAFHIPFFDHPVAWYGLLFVLGIVCGYFIVVSMLKWWLKKEGDGDPRLHASQLADRLTWFALIGGIIGARLGHVFLYEWPYYSSHLLAIFKIWEGGLASHGGAVGVVVGLLFFRWSLQKRYPYLSLVAILDTLAVPIPLVGAFIRVGNFINQEIIGTHSTLPWAVVFVHPVDGGGIYSRHPVQLYEALAYLAIFALLFTLWAFKKEQLRRGILSGLFFLLVFGVRFFLEYVKDQRGYVFNESYLLTGQILSVPFILLGFWLLFYGRQAKR